MIVWGFVGIKIVLPACLKLSVRSSDRQDFTRDILLAQSNLQIDAFPFLVVWLRFILICMNDLYLFGIWRLLALLWSAKNGTQNMGWWKREILLSGLQDISAFDWIRTEKLKTRTNVSAFKPSWTQMYVMADIWESVPNSVKPKPCHDKNRI